MDTSFFNPDSAFFLLSVGGAVLALNILIAVLVAGFAIVIMRNILYTREKAHRIKLEAREQADKILDEAHAEALKVTEQASAKARELLNQAARSNEATEQQLTEGFHVVSEKGIAQIQSAALKCVETFENMADVAEKEYLKTLHVASETMSRDAKHTLEMFESYLKNQTSGYQQEVERKVDDLRAKADQFIEDYRIRKIEKVDSTIHQIILLASKNVLGRILNVDEHNRLILHALDEAKKEKFFEEFQS